MSHIGPLVVAFVIGLAAWFGAGYVVPDLNDVWFQGVGAWKDTSFHGRELVTAAAAFGAWAATVKLAIFVSLLRWLLPRPHVI